MTPTSAKPDAAHQKVRGGRRPDFASRLKGRLRALRARLAGRDAVIEAVRESNATLDPRQVAAWLVRRAGGWVPAPCWAVVAHDGNGHLSVIADEGLSPGLDHSIWGAANWVMRHGAELMSADLSSDSRVGHPAAGTAVAFPLVCRQRTMGVLVGLDPLPSAAPPSLGLSVLASLRELLEPTAIALDNALALQRAEALSVADDLTRLYNSRFLHQVLRREAKRASRSGRPLSLLFIDLDGFKAINTRYGHLAGSKALVEAADVIRGSARETDVAARYGGDEFAVILPDTGGEGAAAVAERVRERLGAFVFLSLDGISVHLSASIGVATLPDAAGSAEELLRAADRAMYRVKDSGKNGIHIAQEEEHPPRLLKE